MSETHFSCDTADRGKNQSKYENNLGYYINSDNSDVNMVNIALIAFCSLAVKKLAHWSTSSLRRRNTRYQNLEKAKINDNCVTNYRPASDRRRNKIQNPSMCHATFIRC